MELGITSGCKIIATGLGGGENNKAPFIAFDVEAPSGEIVTLRLYTSSGAWPYTKSKLARLGWDSDANKMAFEQFNEPDNVLVGVECDISTTEEEDLDGRPRMKHDFWLPARATRQESSKALSLAQTMRAQITAGQGNGATNPWD